MNRSAVPGGQATGPTPHGDAGTAVVEFLGLALGLLVPLVYLTVVLGRVQAATLAVDGAAREAARVLVVSADPDQGHRAAAVVVRTALQDQGLNPVRPVGSVVHDGSVVPDGSAGTTDWSVRIGCASRPCLAPGGRVAVRVAARVALPGVPRGLDRVVPLRVTVRATHIAAVDRHRTVDRHRLREPTRPVTSGRTAGAGPLGPGGPGEAR